LTDQPITPPYQTREIAYARLGVDESAVRAQPQITPQFRMIAKTIRRSGQPKVTRKILSQRGTTTLAEDTKYVAPYGPGSDLVKAWAHYLHASDDPDAKKIITVYYSIPQWARTLLPIEAFCLAAGVSTSRVLEIITAACVRLGAQASTIIAAVSHPSVVQKTVEMALTDDGIEDRNTLHKAAGFLPTPKSAQTNITVTQNAQVSSQVAVSAPSPESTIRTLAEVFNQRKGLPAVTSPDALPPIRDTLDITPPVPVAVEAEEYSNEEDE
jgi:hypothetical protein